MASKVTKDMIADLILRTSRMQNAPSGRVSFCKPGDGLYSNGEIAIDILDKNNELKYRTMATVEETIALNYIQMEEDLTTALKALADLRDGLPLSEPIHQLIEKLSESSGISV